MGNRSNNTESFIAIHDTLKVHGITLKKVLSCVDDKNPINKETWNKIIATRLEGHDKGVNSTPSFFLDEKKLMNHLIISYLKN